MKKIGRQVLIDSQKFLTFVHEQSKDSGYYYLLLDAIQNLENFVRVLNSFIYKGNFDIYVTGSNSNLLSSEVDTEFGGRGDRIHLLPLSFLEYLSNVDLDKRDALDQYIRYGGIPLVQLQINDDEKTQQAISIVKETYLKDLKLKHQRLNQNRLDETLSVIASMISTQINPTKIENTFKSVYHINITNDTIEIISFGLRKLIWLIKYIDMMLKVENT